MGDKTPLYNRASYSDLSEDAERNYRRHLVIASVFGVFIVVFVIIFIVIGVQNGLHPFEGFLVYPSSKDNMITYKMNDSTSIALYIQSLNDLLGEYKSRPGDTAIECPGNTAPVNKDIVCRFNTSHIKATLPPDFGYQDGKPTIILQLRPPVGWHPKVYTNDSTDMSQWKPGKDIIPIDHVPVVCHGSFSQDQENLGEVRVVPKEGFPIKYFPYNGQEDYQYPLVAVQFMNPAVGVMIRIKCELWDLDVALEDKRALSTALYLQVDI